MLLCHLRALDFYKENDKCGSRKLWMFKHITIPTETFQYAHFSSSHLLSVKKGFIKRETLRLLRTNLANETFELRKLEFLTRLLERC